MTESEKIKPAAAEDVRQSSKSPLIFISHDTRDAELAEAFSKLLSSVSAGVLKSFRSSDRKGSQGIDYGVEWYPELMSRLESASDVVCLLTQRSLDRPWILYEAGVAKGKLNTPVYGIALGIPLSRVMATGPFAQFQNCDDKEESLTKLVIQLVRRIPGSEPDQDAILMQVKTFIDRAQKALSKLTDTKPSDESKSPETEDSIAKLFEEVKLMFQDLPSRLEERLSDRPFRHRRHKLFHPMMFHEIDAMSSKGNDPIGLLIIASMLRDDLPWLYEIGIDAYRAFRSGDPKYIDEAVSRFQNAVEFAMHGPFIEEKELHMMLRELPRVLEHTIQRARQIKSSASGKHTKEKQS
jgi:hypothetical protein